MDALQQYMEWNEILWDHFFPQGREGGHNPILNLDKTLLRRLGEERNVNRNDEDLPYDQDFLKKCFMSDNKLASVKENWFTDTGYNDLPDCSSWEKLVKGANGRIGLKDRPFIVKVDGANKVIPAYFGMLCAILFIACREAPNHTRICNVAKEYFGEDAQDEPGRLVDDLLKSLHGDVNSFDADRMVCGTQKNISRMKFHAILKESERKDLIDFLEVNNLEWKDEPYNEYAVNTLIPALSRAGKQKFVKLASGTLKPYNEGSIPYIKNILLSGLNFGKSPADSNNNIQVKDLKWRYYFWVDFNGNPHFSIFPNGLIPFDIYYDEKANEFRKGNDSTNTVIGYDDEIASNIQKLVEIPGQIIEHEGHTYYFDNISINNKGKWPKSLFLEQVDNNAFEQVEYTQPERNYIQLIKTNRNRANPNPPEGWSLWDGCSLDGYIIYKSNGPLANSSQRVKIRIKEKYPIEGAGRWFCIALPKGANDLYWRQNIPNSELTKLDLIGRNDGRFYFKIPVDRIPLNDANDFQHINGDLYFTEKDCTIENIIDQCINKETIKIDLCWNGTDEIYEIDGWGRAVSKDISSNSDSDFNPHGKFLKPGIPTMPSTEQNPLLEVLGDIADKNGCVHEGAMRNALNFVLKYFDTEPSPKKRKSLLYALRRLGYIVAYYDNEKGAYTNQLVAPYLELTNFSIESNTMNAYLVKGIYQRDKLKKLINNAEAKWFKRPFSPKEEVIHPEYKCLPDLVLLKTDDTQGWTTQSPAANTLIGGMKNMGDFKEEFLNHGDVIRDRLPDETQMPCVEKYGNKKFLFDKDNNEVKRYGYYSINTGVYAPIPSSLLKLYCQNQQQQSVCICIKNYKNVFLYGYLAFFEGMAIPEIFRMALCDLNLGMAAEEQIFLVNRSSLNLPTPEDPNHPLTKMYTYGTNATKENQKLILDGINKMCDKNIKDLDDASNRILTIAELIPLKRQKYQGLYVSNDNISLYYIESDYPMPDSLPENYTIVAFTIMKNNKRYLCARKENDQHFVQIKTDNMNQAISQLIERDKTLFDGAVDYNGEEPSIDINVKRITIYKPINN